MTATTGTAAGHYLIDKSASRFTVRAFASGMLSMMGHNPTIAIRDFTGEANLDPAAPAQASLRIQIRADSLEVADEIGEKDRREIESTMKQNVLETAKYPEIVFESTQATADQVGDGRYKLAINGNLSLHGVTRNASGDRAGDAQRRYAPSLRSRPSILQSNYGIAPVSVAGGTLKLKDELKFTRYRRSKQE